MAGEYSGAAASGPAYGNLAYDLNALQPEAEEYAPAAVPTRAEARTARKSLAGLVGLIIGAAFAGALLVAALLGRVQLTAMNDEAVALSRELRGLETEQAALRIRREEAFDLEELERYAREELGMQQPRDDQIFYVSGAAPDEATVLKKER